MSVTSISFWNFWNHSPSFVKGAPQSIVNKIGDYLAAGKPIISTNVGGVKDVVAENETAFLTDLSLEQFAEKLGTLIKDEELRKSMSEKSKTYSSDKFSYERLCSNMEKVYKKHLGNK